jgi:protein gp37
MSGGSRIEWTDATWNPVTGCTKLSMGCDNCYAARMARRLQGMGQARYRNGFRVTLHPDLLALPMRWRKPRRVFVNSMGDLFHERVPLSFLRDVFDVMARAPQHRFQLLTKRAERLSSLASSLPWSHNVWVGVTVEAHAYLGRLAHLASVPAAVRFVSFEPLLGPLRGVSLDGVDWVIVGGESGPGSRPMREEWVVPLRDACLDVGIPFFFKQWGGLRRARSGRLLQGRIWEQFPTGKQVETKPYLQAPDASGTWGAP